MKTARLIVLHELGMGCGRSTAGLDGICTAGGKGSVGRIHLERLGLRGGEVLAPVAATELAAVSPAPTLV